MRGLPSGNPCQSIAFPPLGAKLRIANADSQTQRRVPCSYKCFAIQDRAPVTKRQRSAQYSQSVGADTLWPFRNRYLCRTGRAPEVRGRRETVRELTTTKYCSGTRAAP